MYSAPGFCNEILYMYEAQELTFLGKNLDPDEETDVIILGLAEAWRMALSGELQDAKTIAGLGLLMGTQLS
jgi:ADP-ribose pyrophosphatase